MSEFDEIIAASLGRRRQPARVVRPALTDQPAAADCGCIDEADGMSRLRAGIRAWWASRNEAGQ